MNKKTICTRSVRKNHNRCEIPEKEEIDAREKKKSRSKIRMIIKIISALSAHLSSISFDQHRKGNVPHQLC